MLVPSGDSSRNAWQVSDHEMSWMWHGKCLIMICHECGMASVWSWDVMNLVWQVSDHEMSWMWYGKCLIMRCHECGMASVWSWEVMNVVWQVSDHEMSWMWYGKCLIMRREVDVNYYVYFTFHKHDPPLRGQSVFSKALMKFWWKFIKHFTTGTTLDVGIWRLPYSDA